MGDEAIKKIFRNKYLRYVVTHDNAMRNHPYEHHTLSRAVVHGVCGARLAIVYVIYKISI